MKNFFFFILSFLIVGAYIPVYSIEEVVLDIDETVTVVNEDISNTTELPTVQPILQVKEPTFKEKIRAIAAKEGNDIKTPFCLFEEVLTFYPEKSPIESAHFFTYFRNSVDVDIEPYDTDVTHNFSTISTGVKGKFKNSKTYYQALFRLDPQNRYSFLQYMPSNIYISNTSIPHHTITFGHTRTLNGYEGGMSSLLHPFVARSQIARNFGNVRKVGLKIKGKYDFIEYDIGGFSSDTYFQRFMPGMEFVGWAFLKPLAKTNGKYGNLKIGGGITSGHNQDDYLVSGAYLGYEYKKFTADFEWAKADGYNGAGGLSMNKAEGFYTTLGYRITPKMQLLARYDEYAPNLNYSNDIRREYSTGFNYFLKGQALKLMFNYVFCQNDIAKDSHRIILGTQILL